MNTEQLECSRMDVMLAKKKCDLAMAEAEAHSELCRAEAWLEKIEG